MTNPGSNYNTAWLDEVRFNSAGLVCAIAQDVTTRRNLMVAWMNREALAETVATGRVVYFSRSRQKLWRKGEESGNTQRLREIRLDCDGDVILLDVEQTGGIACHTGRESCFYRRLDDGQWVITEAPIKSPDELYGSAK
ncbi:MAG: phosphoribosyl-AMP cyclohydrolase [Burkholderiaceae bacterium]